MNDEQLVPFSDWLPTIGDAFAAVPDHWRFYKNIRQVVLQRCNLCGVWSYRYVLNRALAS